MTDNRLVLLQRFIKPLILISVLFIHVLALFLVKFHSQVQEQKQEETYEILKLVDVEEYVPPPPPPPKEEPKEIIPEETVQVAASETVFVTEEEIVETVEEAPPPVIKTQEIEYVPQHKISTVPEIPTKQILDSIVYPAMALRQGIEGVVYLELFIDSEGIIRKIEILKDPGYGFAEAALDALKDVVCVPATANGQKVAVRFRYPVRFTLK